MLFKEVENLRKAAALKVNQISGLEHVTWETVRFQWTPAYIGRSYHWKPNTKSDYAYEKRHEQIINNTMCSRGGPSVWTPEECMTLQLLIEKKVIIPILDEDQENEDEDDEMMVDQDDSLSYKGQSSEFDYKDTIITGTMSLESSPKAKLSEPKPVRKQTKEEIIRELEHCYTRELNIKKRLMSRTIPPDLVDLRTQQEQRLNDLREVLENFKRYRLPKPDKLDDKEAAAKTMRVRKALKTSKDETLLLTQNIAQLENKLQEQQLREGLTNQAAEKYRKAQIDAEKAFKRLKKDIQNNLRIAQAAVEYAQERARNQDQDDDVRYIRSELMKINRCLERLSLSSED